MLSFLDKLFGYNAETEEDTDTFDREMLTLEFVEITDSGTPRIRPKDLLKHKKVQRLIKKGAEKKDMGKPAKNPPGKGIHL